METLESAVVQSCGERDSPEGKFAAGVHAAFEYAAANPGSAQALIAQLRAGQSPDPESFDRVAARFWAMIGDVAAAHPRAPASTDAALIGSIAAVINGHLSRGAPDSLAEAAADMIELSLLPYVGFGGARQWAAEART